MKRTTRDSSDEHSKNDKHFSSAFRDLESEVCDLDRMSEIADCLTMEWLETTGSSPPRQAELAVCAVQQLHRLLNEFKTKYYRAFNGDNEVAG
jgi:hypothetical protein